MKPNLIIFKHPHLSADGELQFVEFLFTEEAGIANDGRIFTVIDDDYLEIDFDNIVLAYKVPKGSIDLKEYRIFSATEDQVKIYEMSRDELNIAVRTLVKEFNLIKPS